MYWLMNQLRDAHPSSDGNDASSAQLEKQFSGQWPALFTF